MEESTYQHDRARDMYQQIIGFQAPYLEQKLLETGVKYWTTRKPMLLH